jgi:hypothetical protein
LKLASISLGKTKPVVNAVNKDFLI